MLQTIEVEIDGNGQVKPITRADQLPSGKALLVWEAENPHECYLLSEAALAKDWLRPEEDEAWAAWQPVK